MKKTMFLAVIAAALFSFSSFITLDAKPAASTKYFTYPDCSHYNEWNNLYYCVTSVSTNGTIAHVYFKQSSASSSDLVVCSYKGYYSGAHVYEGVKHLSGSDAQIVVFDRGGSNIETRVYFWHAF